MISWLQRYILIHSILYYDRNVNVIDDREWDRMAADLVSRMSDKRLAKKSEYWQYFYDFDGNTGFDIVERLKEADPEHYDYLETIGSHIR